MTNKEIIEKLKEEIESSQIDSKVVFKEDVYKIIDEFLTKLGLDKEKK